MALRAVDFPAPETQGLAEEMSDKLSEKLEQIYKSVMQSGVSSVGAHEFRVAINDSVALEEEKDALLALAIVFYQLGDDEPLIAQWAWREWDKLSPELQDAIAKAPVSEHPR